MRNRILTLTLLLLAVAGCKSSSPAPSRTNLIWDNGTYASFPSIEKFNSQYFISFREGESHIFNSAGEADGKARIIASKDGVNWESVALLSKEAYDLRDPKLSVTPDGRLMVIMGGSVYVDKQLVKMIPQVSFSSDGKTFSEPEPIIFDERITGEREWAWRVTWHDGIGYTVAYGNHFALLKTTDGLHFDTVCELDIPKESFPNETTVRFLPDGRMALMVRRDSADFLGWWGTSSAPFTDWNWKALDFRVGGPDFTVLPDGEILVGTRSYFILDKQKTILLKGSSDGVFEEIRVLPSGGDCSYPGLLVDGNDLLFVYYSSHELKDAAGNPRAGIYLSRIPLSEL